ncbi:MAG: bifunctional shikimate kinase/3-dehydroquinate synthase [Actinobacteria bacterium]|nr:bifunctional shikimate kinase/3-dehydroquinate synthase [Actinomycetota bacterium]
MATHALDRHLVLVGFMGAGKSTIGADVARRLGREFYDVDAEIERAEGPIPEIFASRGEAAFRELEARFLADARARATPMVVALGAGAVETRELLSGGGGALVVQLEVDVDTAWERARGSSRPLAVDEVEFRRRFELRAPLYAEVANARARDADDVALAAAGIHVETGALQQLERFVEEPAALVTEPVIAGIHGADAQIAFPFAETHELPTGEAAKQLGAVERLWRSLRLGRDGTIVALGGGALTDAAGFSASSYLRGVPWIPVPTTLTGQVDAAIGGKTGIDLLEGKNLVGAFHWPARTVIDPALLGTLPDRERKNGLAEVVKTGLLAGEALWELSDPELVRRCAAFKAAVCLRDPHDLGERKMLNLGHTFAHALEAGARYGIPHGEAVALGLLAALRLSGIETDAVEDVLAPKPVYVDRELAWEALGRDKKGGRLVLLAAPGEPRVDVEVPLDHVRAELDRLIAE